MKQYYELTKPRVTYGNVLTVIAGFLFASNGMIDWWLFLWTTLGMTLVIASACALNNFLDRDIDAKMERTKSRPSVKGSISGRNMVLFAATLGFVGLGMLALYTNLLVVIVALIGYVVYVVFYGMLSKRMSVHGTLVGSISGAAPILAGYVAVGGALDIGAALVFLVIFLWQMPEFYSIAVYRRDEYKAASVPVSSVSRGIKKTKVQIFFYTLAFVITTLLLTFFGYTGIIYTIIMGGLGLYWLSLGFKGLKAKNSDAWARKMFRYALIILLVFSFLISVEAYLP